MTEQVQAQAQSDAQAQAQADAQAQAEAQVQADAQAKADADAQAQAQAQKILDRTPSRADQGGDEALIAKKKLTGVQKAAILMVTLDEDIASEIIKQLPDEEAEILTREIASIEMVYKEDIERVMEEFRDFSVVCQYVKEGGVDYAIRLIEKSFNQNKAYNLIRLLENQKQSIPFDFLKKTETESILTFLGEEHPQTIALVLSYMQAGQAAEILMKLPAEKQFDIVKRISALENTSPEAIRNVESGLRRYLASLSFEEFQEVGGVNTVAELLNVLDRSTSKAILENLEEEQPEIAEEIKKRMFVFEDILMVDDRGIQNVLKEVENKELALALKTASEDLKNKILSNMSTRASETIKEEMTYLGPVRVSDVEAAQQNIVDIVKRLEDQGDVIISGRGGEGDIIV